MYKMLRGKFDDTIDISSTYENLIWKILIPKWGIVMFSKKINFTEEQALVELKYQDQKEILESCNDF